MTEPAMLLLNFAHPLTPAHCTRIEALAGQPLAEVRHIPSHLDPTQPFAEQVTMLLDQAKLNVDEWQTLPLLINLPSLNTIAALMLAGLHGRMGYFPMILRLRPIANSTPPQFEVAEILNLQNTRDIARTTR